MKKILKVVLSFVLSFGLVGCGGNSENDDIANKLENMTIVYVSSESGSILEAVKSTLENKGHNVILKEMINTGGAEYIVIEDCIALATIGVEEDEFTAYLNNNSNSKIISVGKLSDNTLILTNKDFKDTEMIADLVNVLENVIE